MLSYMCTVFLLCKITYSKVPRIRSWTSLEAGRALSYHNEYNRHFQVGVDRYPLKQGPVPFFENDSIHNVFFNLFYFHVLPQSKYFSSTLNTHTHTIKITITIRIKDGYHFQVEQQINCTSIKSLDSVLWMHINIFYGSDRNTYEKGMSVSLPPEK